MENNCPKLTFTTDRYTLVVCPRTANVLSLKLAGSGKELLGGPLPLIVPVPPWWPLAAPMAVTYDAVTGTFSITGFTGHPEWQAAVRIAAEKRWVTVEVVSLSDDIENLCFVYLALADYDKAVHAVQLTPCNPKTMCYGGTAVMDVPAGVARVGAKAAILAGTRTQVVADLKLFADGQTELPKSRFGGGYARGAAINRKPYAMAFLGVTLANVEWWIETVKSLGISRLVMSSGHWNGIYDGTFEPMPAFYANGMADVQAVVSRLKAAGLSVGLHCMSHCIDKGSSYGTAADPRLLRAADGRLIECFECYLPDAVLLIEVADNLAAFYRAAGFNDLLYFDGLEAGTFGADATIYSGTQYWATVFMQRVLVGLTPVPPTDQSCRDARWLLATSTFGGLDTPPVSQQEFVAHVDAHALSAAALGNVALVPNMGWFGFWPASPYTPIEVGYFLLKTLNSDAAYSLEMDVNSATLPDYAKVRQLFADFNRMRK